MGKPGNQGNRVQVSRATGNRGAGYQQTRESGCMRHRMGDGGQMAEGRAASAPGR